MCPRNCRIDRLANKWSFCKSGRDAVVSNAFPHFGEEDCLRGQQKSGREVSADEMAGLRHLVMPDALADTREIMHWIATELGPESYVNVMAQYRPAGQVGKNPRYETINRRIRAEEYAAAVQAAIDAGLSRLDRRVRGGPGLPMFM